jgi:hypothetical protein
MADAIDLKGMPDHDLLVVAVTTLNQMDNKLDTVCAKNDDQEKRLIIIETEHAERKNNGDCSTPIGTPKKTIALSAGVGAIIIAVIDYVLKRFGVS